jgi:hypothetical protein
LLALADDGAIRFADNRSIAFDGFMALAPQLIHSLQELSFA